MFERRLRIILILPILIGIVIVARLAHLQLVRGDYYAAQQDAALVAPRQYLPALRGSILDREGRLLVSDEPAHDVTVHYGALSMSDRYLTLLADRLRRTRPDLRGADNATLAEEAARQVARMWIRLEAITGTPIADLRRRRDSVCRSVESLRRYLAAARSEATRRAGADAAPAHSFGFGQPPRTDQSIESIHLREDELFHPILRDISPQVRTAVEVELADLPFVRVEPSVRRVAQAGTQSFCHILGRLGQVSPELLRDDPNAADPLAAYRADDEAGVSGVERLCEGMLRGKRGYEELFLDKSLKERAAAQDGLDVQLTIDLGVQQRIADLLATAVADNPPSTGAACVVLDVQTREIIALVSVPTYDPTDLRSNYASLRDDTRTVPLRFRAVAEEYQPGSILKPASLLAGLALGAVNTDTRIFCSGALIPGAARWHCWTHWRGMAGHGDVDAVQAIQHSCNIYFYTLGQKLGADALTRFYERFLGLSFAPRGTGLIEERTGIIPTRDWLRENRKRDVTVADGRNYAIGQGELQITPLQAANLFATLAMGAFREPTLIANDARPRPMFHFDEISPQVWETVRRGVYECVNTEGGTAYKYARMDAVEICGKTGSAECVARVTQWRYHFTVPADGRSATIVAPTIESAREQLGLPDDTPCTKREIVERYPPPVASGNSASNAKNAAPTHAWFAGYAPFRQPRIALAVILEHGGGGGHAAGPVARQIVEVLMNAPKPYLSGRSVVMNDQP